MADSGASPRAVAGFLDVYVSFVTGYRRRYVTLRDGTLAFLKADKGSCLESVQAQETHRSDTLRVGVALEPPRSADGLPVTVRAVLPLSQVVGVSSDDGLRFSISTSNSLSYDLRADSAADKAVWLAALAAHRAHSVAPRMQRSGSGDARLAQAVQKAQEVTLGTPAAAAVSSLVSTAAALLSAERRKRAALAARCVSLVGDKVALEQAVIALQAALYDGSAPAPARRASNDSGSLAYTLAALPPLATSSPQPQPRFHARQPSVDDVDSLGREEAAMSGDAESSDEEFYDCKADGFSPSATAPPTVFSPAGPQPPWGADTPAGPPHNRVSLPVPAEPEPRASLWSVLKEAVGKDLTRITLPVTFNEPLSALQRFAEELTHAELLDAAAAAPPRSPERLLLVTAFVVSGYACFDGRTCKPFNPLEKETFEYVCPERGFRFLAEKVRHHPLHLAAHAQGRGWAFWGESAIRTKFWGRTVQLLPSGFLQVAFLDDAQDVYSWRKLPTTVSNIILGPPAVDFTGTCRIAQLATGAATRLRFKEAGLLHGGAAARRAVKGSLERDGEDVPGGPVIFGAWDGALWVVDRPGDSPRLLWRRPPPPLPPPAAAATAKYKFGAFTLTLNEAPEAYSAALCPTDSRLRPDQRLLELGRYSEAGPMKQRLEERQRLARKRLADAGLPVPGPRWFSAVAREAVLAATAAGAVTAGCVPPGAADEAAEALAQALAPALSPETERIAFAFTDEYWKQRAGGDWSSLPRIFETA